MNGLKEKRCAPCTGETPRLAPSQIQLFKPELPRWEVHDGVRLYRQFQFRNFREAIGFVDAMAEISESEGHHPNFAVDYNRVSVTIWTHAIGALSENDFILAAKLDALPLAAEA